MLLGSVEISDLLDLVVRLEDLSCFVEGLFEYLSVTGPQIKGAWKTLDLCNFSEVSPTLPILQQEIEKRGWHFSNEKLQPAPYIPLPGDFNAYLASIDKKQRHEIRRKMRRAEESATSVRWYFVDDEKSLQREADDFMTLMSNDTGKASFLTGSMRDQMRTTIESAFHAGWLQLAFMEVNGEKAAAYLNFDYDNRIWVYNSGIDRRFMEYSPGWVLLGHLLQWANENGRLEFDFMRGGEEYKYRFGAVNRFVVRAVVRRPAAV